MVEQSFLETELGYFVSWSATQLPWLVVGVLGLALVAAHRSSLPRPATGLAVTGCVVVLVGVASFLGWIGGLGRLYRAGAIPFDNYLYVNLGVGAVVTLVQAAGGGLLLAAALAGRRRANAAGPPGPPPPISLR